MNFESKYLIRWGIPGWIFVFWVIIYFLVAYYDVFSKHINLKDFGKLIGLFISLGAFGIIIGYIIQQIYFGVNWVLNKNRVFDHTKKLVEKFPTPANWGKDDKVDYFYFEFFWHKELLSLDEPTRDYIVERYRYLLSTIHGLGTTVLSHILAFGLTIGLGLFKFGIVNLPWSLIFINLTQLLIALIVFGNFVYYSANLSYLQGYFLNAITKNQISNQKASF